MLALCPAFAEAKGGLTLFGRSDCSHSQLGYPINAPNTSILAVPAADFGSPSSNVFRDTVLIVL
jgi:hypothetical protein